jgi:predicted ATPase
MVHGIWFEYVRHADYAAGVQYVQDVLAGAEADREDGILMMAHRMLGLSYLLMGELDHARDHMERALAMYDGARHGSVVAQINADPRANTCASLAWASFLLGSVEQGRVWLERAVTAAAGIASANAQANIQFLLAMQAITSRDLPMLEHRAGLMAALTKEHRLPLWRSNVALFRAWAALQRGRPAEAVVDYERGLADRQAVDLQFAMPFFVSGLALALAKSDRDDEARLASWQAIADSEKSGERWCLAELWRVRGEVFLQGARRDPDEAARCFERALAQARSQGARLWELRAMTGLARLLADRGERPEAVERLASVCARFADGFDCVDLVEARTLLDALA